MANCVKISLNIRLFRHLFIFCDEQISHINQLFRNIILGITESDNDKIMISSDRRRQQNSTPFYTPERPIFAKTCLVVCKNFLIENRSYPTA